ncbi:type IX secretion system outer membrane channel protein PorV [Saprospiraceae bacterium]|nr:type IX secretion system outer membrane channel protein PorV [Saprospiraceae bacterium]
MKNNITHIILLLVLGLSWSSVNAQFWDPIQGCLKDADTENAPCLSNTLLSAVPFLRIVPDSRSGAMGDVGIAISADPNAMHFNASKLAFAENDLGISATYSPWLQGIGLKDVYMAYLTGYKRIDDLQTLGFGLRFFSLGQIDFADAAGNPTGSGKPREFALSFAYSRKLAENFSASLSAKYIYSNLAQGQMVDGIAVTAANAFATDLSLTYFHDLDIGGYDSRLNYGFAMTNLGSKVTYTRSNDVRDFLPGNIGLGVALDMNLDDYNLITIAFDVNKLLVPTPTSSLDTASFDVAPANGIADYREQGLISGILGSFGDAPGGFSEEFQEIYYSFGAEYWYDKQFAVRAGYYYESPRKGDRQFLTVGVGLKYNTLNMNISYLVPTTIRRSPLDNTLRFGIIFNLGEDGATSNE